ncbi:hypothetical protein B0H17DRAFT_933412, partial [Mycena rosella]
QTLYMPWECEHEHHAYEKCVCGLRFPPPILWYPCSFPFRFAVQMPIRRVRVPVPSSPRSC